MVVIWGWNCDMVPSPGIAFSRLLMSHVLSWNYFKVVRLWRGAIYATWHSLYVQSSGLCLCLKERQIIVWVKGRRTRKSLTEIDRLSCKRPSLGRYCWVFQSVSGAPRRVSDGKSVSPVVQSTSPVHRSSPPIVYSRNSWCVEIHMKFMSIKLV